MPAVQSKIAPPSARPRTTSSALPAANKSNRSVDADKENLQPGRHRASSKKTANADEDKDYDPPESEDNDEADFANAGAGAQLLSDHSDDEEEEAPQGRIRRLSDKEAQRRADKEEADARKAAKAAKAAKAVKKQRDQEMGVEPIPLEDTVFTSRDVELPVKKKSLQQRDSRVPTTQARPMQYQEPGRGRTHEPSQDLRHIIAANRAGPSGYRDPEPQTPQRGLASASISDWRRSAVAPPMEIDSEPPRPRSINGNVFPARVQVDLRYAPSGSSGPSRSHARDQDLDDQQRRARPQERHQRYDTSPSRSYPSGSSGPSHSRAQDVDDQQRRAQPQERRQHYDPSPSRSRSRLVLAKNMIRQI
ncbi:hypothetical protein DFH06DRAFT_754751 [Mycena polygramma]|nr:hypothetical protein DFH06DRAFT_754751 [Mycena polygramma]